MTKSETEHGCFEPIDDVFIRPLNNASTRRSSITASSSRSQNSPSSTAEGASITAPNTKAHGGAVTDCVDIPSLCLLVYRGLLVWPSELFSRNFHVLLDEVLSTRPCDLVVLLLGELSLDLGLGCVAPVRRREDAEGNRDAGVKIQDADLRVREPLLEPFELGAERSREMSLLLAWRGLFSEMRLAPCAFWNSYRGGNDGVDKEERNVGVERAWDGMCGGGMEEDTRRGRIG